MDKVATITKKKSAEMKKLCLIKQYHYCCRNFRSCLSSLVSGAEMTDVI